MTGVRPEPIEIPIPPRRDVGLRRLTIRNFRGLLRWLRVRARHPSLRVGLFFMDARPELTLGGAWSLEIGREVRISQDFRGRFYAPVSIGDGVRIERNVIMVAHAGLTIGNHALIGEYTSIHDNDHIIRPGDDPVGDRPLLAAPIVIGNNVWIGAKATITRGVTIGDNSVIGANAVVTRDIPPNSIAVGIPARVIRTI